MSATKADSHVRRAKNAPDNDVAIQELIKAVDEGSN
jgi:hypothetical protein